MSRSRDNSSGSPHDPWLICAKMAHTWHGAQNYAHCITQFFRVPWKCSFPWFSWRPTTACRKRCWNIFSKKQARGPLQGPMEIGSRRMTAVVPSITERPRYPGKILEPVGVWECRLTSAYLLKQTSSAWLWARRPARRARSPSPTRAESREPRAESREPRAESREPRAESREPRAESREPRAESREPRAESREPRAESRESRAGGQGLRVESRE